MTDDPGRWSKADIKLDKQLELQPSQIKDLKTAFDYFDKSGSGVISVKFLKIAFRALGFELMPQEMKKVLSEAGVDKDMLSFHDFLHILEKKMTEQDDEMRVIQTFRFLDMDGSGGITFDNLKTVSEQIGANLNDEELQEMIEEGDLGMRGLVTLQDFKYIMERFYKMQSKDVQWCFKYPKSFDYYAVCSLQARRQQREAEQALRGVMPPDEKEIENAERRKTYKETWEFAPPPTISTKGEENEEDIKAAK